MSNDTPLPLEQWLVFYDCLKTDTPVIRAVEETDTINAIIEARRDERRVTGSNCPLCILTTVRLVDC